MAKPPEDPRVADLARYRKQREAEARKKPPRPPGSGLLGSNPRAGLILGLLAVAAILYFLAPLILSRLH